MLCFFSHVRMMLLCHVEVILLLAQTQCPGDPGHEGSHPLHCCGEDQGQAQGVSLVNNYPSQRGTCNREESVKCFLESLSV